MYASMIAQKPKYDILDYLRVGAKVKADFACVCTGDSMMNARILDGDIVYVVAQDDVEDGEIAVVEYDGTAIIRRVYKRPDGMVLHPENYKYPDIVVDNAEKQKYRILGKAIVVSSVMR